MKLNRKWVVLFIFLLAIFSNTCKSNVGLGGHIDITPPTCQLTFPVESLPTIRNSFTLKGVASDDNAVDKVKVVLKSVDRAWEGALELPCNVEKSGDAWQWSVVVNSPNADGSFPLKDGKYNVKILSYDKDGKEGESTSVLIIDNTPPVLFLQRPSSFATSNKENETSDNYGADLIIKGSAADDSGLSSLELFAYGKNWESETIKNVSTSINIKVDGFFSSTEAEKGIYRKLYGDKADAGLKTFPCAIKVYDNAKEYDSPNSNGEAEKGNICNDYYLYDVLYNIEDQKDVNKQLIFPKYKVQDVYDMLKGTFYLNDKGIEDAEKKTEAKYIIDALKTGKFGDSTKRFKISCPSDTQGTLTDDNRALMGLLGLNPFKNPTYEVLGFDPCKIDFNATSHADVYNECTRAKGGSLTIKVSPNLDESPLKEAKEFEFYYCELSSFVKYYKENHHILTPSVEGFKTIEGVKEIEGVNIKKVGSSYMATVPVGDALTVGSSYVVLIKGSDKEDNPVMLDPTSIKTNSVAGANVTYCYGLKVVGTGRLSDVKVIKIGDYGKGTNELSDRAFVKYNEDVIFEFIASSENEPVKVSYKLDFNNTVKASDEKTPVEINVPNRFTIDKSKFERGEIHTLIVEVTDATAQITSKKYSIWCDDKAPEVDIKPFDEFLTTFPAKINARLYDVGSGVDTSDLKVEYTNNGTRKPIDVIEKNAETAEWELADITPAPKEGIHKFHFTVKDKVGNEAEKTITIKYDLKAPSFVEVNGVQGEALKEGKRIEIKNFANIEAISLSGKIEESNGIASLKVGVDGEFDDSNPSTYQEVATSPVTGQDNTYSFNTQINLKEENKERTFILKVVDVVGRETILKIKVLADKTPPIFDNVRLGITDFKATNTNNFAETGKVIIGSSVVALTANVSDSGSGVKELKVALNGTPTASPNEAFPKTFVAVPDNNGKYLIDGLLNLGLGKTPLKFTLVDKFGNETSWNCEISIENASLVLLLDATTTDPTFSHSKDATTREARGDVKLSASGTNTTGSSPLDLELIVEKDSSPVEKTRLSQLFPNLLAGLSVDEGKIKGLKSGTSSTPAQNYELMFKPNSAGTDDGRYVFNLSSGTATKKFVVIVDNKAPSITPIYPLLGATVFDASSDIKISCYDEASGIKKIECEYKTGKVVPMTLNDASYTCKIPTADVKEGSYTLKFRSEDKLGNPLEISLPPLYYDKADPNIELQGNVPERIGPKSSSTTVSVKMEDSNELKSFIATLIKKSGNDESWKDEKNIPANKTSHTENVELKASNFTKGDGVYILRIECKDVAEKSSKVIEKEIVFDSTSPTLNVTTLFPEWINTRTYKVEGTATDGTGIGVKVVKYKLNDVYKTALSGKDSWDGYVELNEGENRLSFFAEDEVKNESEEKVYVIKVDTVSPTLDFITPSTGEKLLDAHSPLGEVVVSANDNASGIKEVRYSEDSNSTFENAILMNKVGNNYKADITSTPPVSEYYFWAKDKAGNVSSVKRIKVEVDGTLPEISLKQFTPMVEISSVKYANKVAVVTGTVSDDREIKDVKIKDESGADLKGFNKLGDWSFAGNKKADFSFSFDTTQYANGTILKIKAIAIDSAGNESNPSLLNVNIKQETDIPVVTISSFDKISNASLVNSKRLTGDIKDDDGIESVQIKLNDGSFRDVTKQGSETGFWTWVYQLPDEVAEGSVKLEFKVVDSAGTTFTVGNADAFSRVRVKGSDDDNSFKDENIRFNYDNTQPEISSKGVTFSFNPIFPVPGSSAENYSDIGTSITTNTVLGSESNKNISFRILAYDASEIKSAKLILGGVTKKSLPSGSEHLSTAKEGKFDVIDFNNVDISDITQGSVLLKVEIMDNSGFVSTWQSTCIVDFKAPTVELVSPIDTVYFGEVSVMGKITDEPVETGASVSGVEVDSIAYSIGSSGFVREHKDEAVLLSSIENTSATWTIKIPSIEKYAGKPEYGAQKHTGESEFWTVPVKIKALDKAGNEVTSEAYNIKFDPAGDTPFVEILSPNNGSILGGTVVLSGTARVANPNSGKHVNEIHLQLSKTSNFDGSQFEINGKDYGKNGGEKLNLSSNIIYWTQTFNVSDLLETGENSKDVYFRLRGKSGTGSEGSKTGEWTLTRKFTISTDVAKFENVKLIGDGYDEAYVANAKWIKGNNYKIKGSVSHDSGIKVGSVEAKTGIVGNGIQILDQSGNSTWFTRNGNNYDFEIPIKTTHYDAKYGYIEFDIKATDARNSDARDVSQKILLKYDNSAPSCIVGSSALGNNKVSNASFFSGKFTSSVELENDKSSYSVLVNGKRYEIDEIAADKKRITLQNATDLTGDFQYSIVKNPKILQGNACPIKGVAEDLGSGIKEVHIKLEVNNVSREVVINSYATTSLNKLIKEAGNMVSFYGALNTETLDNGVGTLTVTAIDEAGNEVTQVVSGVRVKNSPIEITNVIFSTDLSGNGHCEGDEIYNCLEKNPNVVNENGWRPNDDKDFRGKIDVSNVFTYKNKEHSHLEINCTGGKGEIEAKLYRIKNEEIATFNTKDIDEIALGSVVATTSNSTSTTVRTLKLDLHNVLTETDDGNTNFILKITDESIGKLWYAGMKITTKVEIGDSVKPRGAIFPFFYNSDKDKLESAEEQKLSSVYYEGKEPKGHIEIGKFETHEVSSVSGKVILRGFCYDNKRLKTIKLTLPKDSKSTSGTRVKSSETKTSNYSGSSGWTGDLDIKKNNFTNTGHYVEWEYVWDSDETLCAENVEIKIEVVDAKDKLNGTNFERPSIKQGTRSSDNDRAIELTGGDEANRYDVLALTDKDEKVYFVTVSEMKGGKALWTNVSVPSNIENYALYNGGVNVPTMKINVVPYISKVSTSLSSYSTATPSLYDRTALGHYPCREDDNKVEVKGFNLKDAKFYLADKDLGASTILNLTTAKSGALEARVNYTDNSETKVIKSLNNTDDNDRAYNKCPNGMNNDLLTNDVLLDVWGFKVGARPSSGFIAYPVLKISPKNGRVGLAFANGVEFFNMAGYNSSNGDWKSARQFDQNWAQYVFTEFVFDENDYSYGMATGVDMNKGEGVASYSKFFARRAGGMNQRNNYGKNSYTGDKQGFGQRLENIGTQSSPYTADPDRIQSPSIATVVDSSSKTCVYLAYYDAINKHIRYRYGMVSGTYGESVYGDSSNGDGQLTDLKGYGRMQESDASSYSILAGPKTTLDTISGAQGSTGEDKAGKYVSLGAIKNGAGSKDVVVALWYNFKGRSLMYAYCDDPRKDNVTWKGVKEVDVGGEYVKCAVDGDNGIHVAYYSNGDLKYAYLSSYSSTDWKVSTVDSYSLAGTHVSIDLAKDPSSRRWVPYIGYYMAGNANARLAYLVDGVDSEVPDGAKNEKYTGNWEISIVPTKSAIREYRISVGVWKEPNGADKGVLKAIPKVSHENVSGDEGESLVGGNGTANPILGYAIEEGGAFELAQKK